MGFFDFFSSAKPELPKDMSEVSREQLINLVLNEGAFTCPFTTTEIEKLFMVSGYMFRCLSIEDESFDKKFDTIVVGTYIAACVLEQNKYCKGSAIYYALSYKELLEQTKTDVVYLMGINEDEISVQNLINNVGSCALEGKIPLDEEFINRMEMKCKLFQNVPLKNRLLSYLPEKQNSVLEDDSVSSAVAASSGTEGLNESGGLTCRLL